MERPTRQELIHALFRPAPTKGFRTRADSEAERGFAMATAKLMLHDLLGIHRRAYEARGPGTLVIRLRGAQTTQSADFLPLADWVSDLEMARQDGMTDLADKLKEFVQRINDNDWEQYALFVLIDNSAMQLLQLPIHNPERILPSLLREVL